MINGKIEVVDRIPLANDLFVLGDTKEGSFYLLARGPKNSDEGKVKLFGKNENNELTTKYLGTSSIPQAITFLKNGTFFLGNGGCHEVFN